MDRRRFLQTAAGAAVLQGLSAADESRAQKSKRLTSHGLLNAEEVDVRGHSKLARFTRKEEQWTVYEDLRVRDGVITFVSSDGQARILRKTAEQTFASDGPQHLGLDLKSIGLSAEDLLADKLLRRGEPNEGEVRQAAPPMDSMQSDDAWRRPSWNTIVGTRECNDTMPVYPSGNTRTYHPMQYFHELTQKRSNQRYEGLIGGWMPAVRKIMPDEDASYFEVVVFGDVLAKDQFIVQTWHRTVHIQEGKIIKVEYGYSYPTYTRRRQPPAPADFYLGLLEFAEYWEQQMADMVRVQLPDPSWTDMARYAFVKEQIVRPGGIYPKYGAVDRDYYGPEYDGFQDIFTMSLYSNLECGRFDLAHEVFDNYFTHFTDDKGVVNMRGPETAQYGLTLSLVARYFRYTKDRSLLIRHREKIEAIATMLMELQDEALLLAQTDPGHGLIHGWCESDSCLAPDPSVWWKPYFANSAFAVRGWRDLADVWCGLGMNHQEALAKTWLQRAEQLQACLVQSVDRYTRAEMTPPYIAPLPGAKLTFRESLEQEHPSEQQWAHRCYSELLQANVLRSEQENCIVDCMRAYGATTLGVVANIGRPSAEDRAILGFISYGYAQSLLRLGRIEEYILFLYSHRYHDHSRGSWTAGEVAGITGGGALFCIPAQQTIPLLVRWMLVLEDADKDRLYFGRGVPRAWMATGKPISISGAPTRWGRVDYEVVQQDASLLTKIALPTAKPAPRELHVALRCPVGKKIKSVTVNGESVTPQNMLDDAVTITPTGQTRFQLVAHMEESL